MYNTKELLNFSKENNWALPHFNVHNPMFAKAVLQAAKECNSPVVIAVGYQALKYLSLSSLSAYLKQAIEESGVKASLHFDHAKDLDIIKDCIKCGFTSLMFDGSMLSLEENTRITSEVMKLAAIHNISVEAEIGIVPTPAHGSFDVEYTDPNKAKSFYENTKVDFLAVALGSIHGGEKAEHNLNLDLLKNIDISVPFVIHGASGVTKKSIQEAILLGVRKVNINTALKISASQSMAKSYKENSQADILEVCECATQAIKEKAIEYIYLFNAQNKIN